MKRLPGSSLENESDESISSNNTSTSTDAVEGAFVSFLKESHCSTSGKRTASRKQMDVCPGRSVTLEPDSEEDSESEQSDNSEVESSSDDEDSTSSDGDKHDVNESDLDDKGDHELEPDLEDISDEPEINDSLDLVGKWAMVDFGVVKCGRNLYIGVIQKQNGDSMEGNFLKPYRSHKDQWVFPEKEDILFSGDMI